MIYGLFNSVDMFSESTARALEYYAQDYPELLETSRFVKFVNNLWKVMSPKTPSKGTFEISKTKLKI